MIKICPKNCEHVDQDKIYGIGKRVFNLVKKGTVLKCTVCGAEIQLSGTQIKENKLLTKVK